MQNQVTSGDQAGQGSSVGRFVLTLILHGAAAVVNTAFSAVQGVLASHDIQVAHASSEGPLSSDDDRARIPIIPPFSPPLAALPPDEASTPPAASPPSGVLLDLNPDKHLLDSQPDAVSASDANGISDGAAQQGSKSGDNGAAAPVGEIAEHPADQNPGDRSRDRSAPDNQPGLVLEPRSVAVDQGAVVLDQNGSGDSPSGVSAPVTGEIVAAIAFARTVYDALERAAKIAGPEAIHLLRRFVLEMDDRSFDIAWDQPDAVDVLGAPGDSVAPPPSAAPPEPVPVAPESDRPR